MTIKIVSWSVNCLIQRYYNNHLKWVSKENPDIFCFQETRANKEQITKNIKGFEDYHLYVSSSYITPNYAGTAIYSKIKPSKVQKSFECNNYFDEGWILKIDFNDLILLNVYFPSVANNNSSLNEKTLMQKIKLYEKFLNLTESLLKYENNILICGNFNIAHKLVDICNFHGTLKQAGFLQVERALLDRLVSQGYHDAFRIFNKKLGNFTWSDNKYRKSKNNNEMRLDYFFVNNKLKEKVLTAYNCPGIVGSDHTPIGIEIKL